MRLFPALLLAAILLLASPAFSQGCAMCKTNADAMSKQGQRALNRAILVMVIPPVALMLLGGVWVRRYARRRDGNPQ